MIFQEKFLWAGVIQQIPLAIFGGYFLTSVMVALLGRSLHALAGLPRSEAVVLANMLGILLYLAVLIWAFTERKLLRLWVFLAFIPLLAHLLLDLQS